MTTQDSSKQVARELASLKRQVASMSRASQAANRSLQGGSLAVYDNSGTYRGTIGQLPDGTTGFQTVHGPTPPQPSAPILSPMVGGLEVSWDGTFWAGAAAPGDLRRIEVHASPYSVYTPTEATHKADFIAPGTISLSLPSDPYTVVFVAVTTSDARSTPSVAATETPQIAPSPAEIDAARQAAADAQTTANAANAKALEAAGIAADKGKVAIQSTAPTGDVNTLWIDTTVINGAPGNIPKRWNGSAWVPVQDASIGAAQASADRALVSGGNVIADPSFELGTRTVSGRFSYDTVQKRTGAKSLKSFGAGNTDFLLATGVPVLPGQKWRARVWRMTDAAFAGASGNSKLRLGSQAGASVAASAWTTVSTPWVLHEVVYVVPSTGAVSSLDLRIQTDHTAGTIWFDDAELVEVADVQAAADAAAAAASSASSALTAAQTAQSKADSAMTAASAAQTTADGKNKVWWRASTNPPPAPYVTGDLWFLTDLGNQPRKYDGANWVDAKFEDGAIASLNVGKLVTGTLAAGQKIIVGTPAGARIELAGSSGFQMYDTDGVSKSIDFAPGGIAKFSGQLSGSSVNYVEGQTGWRIDSNTNSASFQSMQVFGSLSAAAISASSITVQGKPLTDIVSSRPLGLISQGINSTVNVQNVTAETGVVELGFTAYPGRGYLVVVDGPVVASSTADTVPYVVLKATTDGSAPGVGSPLLAHLGDFPPGGPTPGASPTSYPFQTVKGSFLWYPPGITNQAGQQVRMLMAIGRSAGSVNGTVGANATAYRCQMAVYDMGAALPNSMQVNNSTAVAPPPPPPPPVQSYTETMYTTWTASYRQDGSRWSDNGVMYQGYGDAFNGNQASLLGFDYAYMRSKLVGSTIKSAVLYIRNQHTWNSTGATAWVGSHNFAGTPATYTGGGLERRASVNTAQGGWLAVDVLGVFNEIRDNASTGLMLGRAPDNGAQHYGYWYGQNAGILDMPRVVVTWEK